MSVKVYEINGEWLTWDHLHNVLGYTMTPSVAVSYKSAAHDTWGEDAGNGYVLNGNGELSRWSMWSEGIVGWFGANDLAEQGAYPASSANLFLERTGETAKAVSLDDGTNTYYLIDGYLDLGWRLWEVLEAEGWQISIDGELAYIVVDEETGTIVHSIIDEGMVYGEVGYVLMDETGSMITVYETGVPVEEFWLGANGRASTDDVTLQANSKQYLRGEDGQLITDAGTIALYDQAPALAYIKADGNTYEAASGDYAFENERYPGSGEDLSLYTVDTGSTRSAWAALFEKKDIVLKVKWGDTVNVPSGLKVSEVRTFVGYAFKSYFGDYSGDSSKIVAFPGKNVYFDNIPGHAMLSGRTYSEDPTSIWPLVEVFQTTGQHLVGKYLTVGYKNAIPEWVTQDRSTNDTDSTAGEYSVYLRGNNTTAIINAINNGYPVRYLWFVIDDQGNACWWKSPEAFRVPHDLWSFSHGTFSWLGNSEDITSLAWWYKHDWELFEWEEFDGVWFYVHCLYDPTPEPEPPAPSELTAYFTTSGAAYEYDEQINQGGGTNLYDASGADLYYDSSKAYTITGLYNAAGELLTFGDGDSMGNNSTYLYYNRGINLQRVWAHNITYTVS